MTIQTAGFLSLLFMAICLPSLSFSSPQGKFQAADWAVLHSSRNDQRHVSSRGVVQTMLEKILPGKLKALYAQSCLLNQGFVKDPNVTVDALLKQVGKELGDDVSVVSFVRYQLGA